MERNVGMISIKNTIEKIQHAPAPLKASIAFALCSVIQKGVQFFTVPIFTRLMTTEQFGEVNVYQSWMNILTIFATFNLASGCFNNGMLKYEDDRDGYTSSMQGLSFLLTAITMVVCLSFHGLFTKHFKLPSFIIYAMFLELFLQPSVGFWSARQRYEFKYKALFLVTLAITLLNALLGIIGVLSFKEKGFARILSIVITNAAVGLCLLIINISKGKVLFNLKYWKFAILFNLPLIPHYLSQVILGSSDRLMIEMMFNASDVAVYSVSYNIGMVMSIVINSINASFVPVEYNCLKKQNYTKVLTLSKSLVVFMAIVSFIPIIFGPELVRILGTEEYYEAVWVIPPVAIGIYFTFIYSLCANVEFYFEKTKYVMIASIIAAISNILFNFIFMRKYGYIAAGYTTFACYGIMTILHYVFMRRILVRACINYNVYDFKFIFIISSTLIFLSSLALMTYSILVVRYVLVLIFLFCLFIRRKRIIDLLKAIKQ